MLVVNKRPRHPHMMPTEFHAVPVVRWLRRAVRGAAIATVVLLASACASTGATPVAASPTLGDSVALAGELAGGTVSSSAIGIPPFQVLSESTTHSALGYALADILAAEKALAFRLFDALGVTLSPAERQSVEAYATTSIPALNAYGRGVQATMLGDHRRAIDEFDQAFTVDPTFSLAFERAESIRSDMRKSASAPSVLPGMRAINEPINGTVDRVNRPLDILTSLSRPLGGPGDPSFPSTVVTVIITVTRP